jgi:hypothetical protein
MEVGKEPTTVERYDDARSGDPASHTCSRHLPVWTQDLVSAQGLRLLSMKSL